MNIKEIRTKTNLSAQKFGDKYGIPLRTIQDWERGERKPPEYVVDLLNRVVEMESIIPMVYVFEKYRDKGGIGSIETFTDATEAIKTAVGEWYQMNQADKRSYTEDSAGVFRVYLARAEWDDVDCEYVPTQEKTEVWDAFDN